MSDKRPPRLQAIKRLGQNFLQDPGVARRIVEAVRAEAGDRVVEIGPGTGSLTGGLLERFGRLTAIEIDPRAVELLRARYPDADVILGDVLDVDWAGMRPAPPGKLVIVGNLPYNITTPILFGLLDASADIRESVIMMQREVADRIVAPPRTKPYGILSVAVQLLAKPELLFTVNPAVFVPRPAVRSGMVRLAFRELSEDDRKRFTSTRALVRAAFNQRRKTLRNSLRSWKPDIVLPDWALSRRAEELSPLQFVELNAFLSGV